MTQNVQYRIEEEVLSLFRAAVSTHELRSYSSSLVDYVEAYLTRPAKRLRPWLLSATAEAYGVTNQEAVLRVGAATELLHVFALMHDDRLDGEQRIAREGAAEDVEQPYQVLGGDILHTIALHTLNDAVREFGLSEEILDIVRSVSLTTITGQASDIDFTSPSAPAPTLARLHALYDLKTGYYSFVAPLTIGAIMGHASEHDRGLLKELGLTVGRMYQMGDDGADILAHLDRNRRGEGRFPARWEFNLVAAYLFEREGIDMRGTAESDEAYRELLAQVPPESIHTFIYEATAPERARCRSYIHHLDLSAGHRRLLHEAINTIDEKSRLRHQPM